MPENTIDLAQLFQQVTQALASNQSSLNEADTYNHDHGDNIVKTFQTITNAVQAKKGASAGTQLAYAGKALAKPGLGGSAALYSKGLLVASKEFKNKQVSPDNILDLFQTLMGGGQTTSKTAQSPAADLLGQLLGGQQSSQSSGSPLGDLLGSLTGAQSGSSDGFGLDDVLNIGGALLGGGQQNNSSPLGNIIGSLIGGSPMSKSPDRSQSAQLILQTVLPLVLNMLKK